jgi:glyoxylase-like metal-dependent hydrolase (beta-lactamase superfamily II)
MMMRTTVLGGLLAIGTLTATLAGQQSQAPRPTLPDAEKVKDNLYVITASTPGAGFTGGNVGVFVTDGGVVVIDTKLAGYGPDLIARIKKITDKPVTTIINTHTHGDHTGSNEGFPGNVEIIAQENTKANMIKMPAFKDDKARFLPKKTFTDKMTVGSGKDRIELYYFGAGHTNGDLFVVFPTLRVMHAGDMFAWKDAPGFDRNNGGSGVEHPKSLAKLVAAVKNVDTVIPGHSPVTTWKDLQEYGRYSAELLSQTEAALKAGKTAEEAAKAIDLTAKYPGYENQRLAAAVTAIYAELKK